MSKNAMDVKPETRELFLRMVGDFAVDRKGVYPDCSNELEDLLYLAQIHSLGPVIYHMLQGQRKQLMEQKPELFQRMQRAYHSAVYVSVTQEASRAEIEEAVQNAGIQLVFFKGAQLRQLYPVPELRTMGDMDCLIRQEDRPKVHTLMEQLGYWCELSDEHVWVYRRDVVVIEIHTHVAGGRLGNGYDYLSYFFDAMDHVVEQAGKLCLERECHFCYLIYHIAKHLSSTGAGVRMVADIAAFVYRYRDSMDWLQVETILRETKLWKTATAVYGLCQRWFGLDPPSLWAGSEEMMDELETYVLTGGTFGFETHDAGDVYRRNALLGDTTSSGIKYWLRLFREYFFPKRDYLVKYYPLSKGRPWLLPVAWVCRCWMGAVHRKEHSLATLRSMTGGDAQRSCRELLMLREMDL